MQATIGVWSPTLLEVKLHSVPASLLVNMYLYAIVMSSIIENHILSTSHASTQSRITVISVPSP